FGTWGVCLLIIAGWIAAQNDSLNLRLAFGLPALSGGVLMLRHEIRRRRSRTALYVQGPVIAIYRRGDLALAAPREEIQRYEAGYITTIKFIMLPLFLGTLGLLPVIDLTNPLNEIKPPIINILAGLSITVAGLVSAASLIWTRHVWLTYRLPRPNGIYEDFNLPRGQAGRLSDL
ncbi:MAG: hypothetical protein ABL955_10020, partial [Elusimicrobiota bacterium]